MSADKLKPAEVIERLLAAKLRFAVRVYLSDDGKTICEIFAKNDWCAVAGSFSRGVFDLDMDDRMNPIAKAVFVL